MITHPVYTQIYIHWNTYTQCSKKKKKYTHIHTFTHLSDKTALHQGSLLTSLRLLKSHSKIWLLLMPAGSPVNGTTGVSTLCVIENARTVMADKEGHFISGSSLILMKTSHLCGHLILGSRVHFAPAAHDSKWSKEGYLICTSSKKCDIHVLFFQHSMYSALEVTESEEMHLFEANSQHLLCH